jgi:predicted 2-oxoglutarate/Fe(II)-dependent dioxygenase YbiX
MKTNLEEYIKVYKMIDADVCDKTCDLLSNIEWSQHRFYSSAGLVDNGNEPYESHQHIDTTEILQQRIWESLKKYILEDINFSWFPGWQGFSNLKFIKYVEGNEMTIHCDHIHSLYDGVHKGIPILTIIGLLNDDFEGGDLVMFDDLYIKLTKGDIVIFPSVFLYPHRIEKIIKGTRYSVISWCN